MTNNSEKSLDTSSEQEESNIEQDQEEQSTLAPTDWFELEKKAAANENLKEVFMENIPYKKKMVDSNNEEIKITKDTPYINLKPNRRQRRLAMKMMIKNRKK